MATKKKSSKKIFNTLLAGLEDAIAFSKGDKTRAKVIKKPPKPTTKFAIGSRVGLNRNGGFYGKDVIGTITAITGKFASLKLDSGLHIAKEPLSDLKIMAPTKKGVKPPAAITTLDQKIMPNKNYLVYAEVELKAKTPTEAKKQFMKLLQEFEEAIDVQENEITEPNINLASWTGALDI